ncbi:MAG TPA: hypothetical protein VFS37_14220 [Conexibacter sp.]|nr:hypothetical protein [Conexibacter sp.]
MSRVPREAFATLLVCVPLALGACGGGDTPGYCADRSQLESSIQDLADVNPSQGLAGLEAKLRTIQSDANALVASARSDFPDETDAIETSVERLSSDVSALPSNPSTAQVAALASDASSVVGAVSAFVDATQSECE